ncbi:MAG: hypothetical protein H6Q33_4491 [Deltaproteobacteria bacterium]|jgi:hypothetical protein|nr:hypothetical protein [Deltaproteobacteria bacterium]
MSHITGTVQVLGAPLTIGPASGAPPNPPGIWAIEFDHTPAPTGTKFVMLHFQNVNLPGTNRLEVDLGYDTDVFTSADAGTFWTRPINVQAFASGKIPVRYIAVGAPAGSAQIDRYGRGERHAGAQDPTAFSNSDPFFVDPAYTEPEYDPFWYCVEPPNWENVALIPAGDIRAQVARSVGMIVTVHGFPEHVSTCTVTLADSDKVISAGHCHNQAEALTSSVIFGYEVDQFGNPPAGYSPRFHKVTGALKVRHDGTSNGFDYSLLQLKTSPAGIAPIQLRHDIPLLGEKVFGIHHPNGAVKKISVPHASFATVTGRSTMGINVPSNFHVSGGSSGSGLFDEAGRIVGVLSNGDPCSRIFNPPTPLRYFPTATILTDIAPAPPPPVNRDVMLVIDRSGSMDEGDGTGRKKIDAAKDAVSLFIQLVRVGGNRAGFVSFSTSAGAPKFDIAPVTDPNKTTMIGPPPFAGGTVGSITPGGRTSIGEGLDAARAQFPVPGANPRAILLLTDGLQNEPRSIQEVEPLLDGIDVHAIGLGSDANLDGELLSAVAARHNGLFTRASSGLALLKFFSQAFGNIFEAGVLLDPEFDLPANVSAPPLDFRVCGEERLTVVVGWDRTDATLHVQLRTPGGTVVSAATAGVESSSGRNWRFLRVPLPQVGERNGLWKVEVLRPGGGGEFPPPAPALRYFVNVIPAGGPKLVRAPESSVVYTGDTISPLLAIRQADGSWPDELEMVLTVLRPDAGLGNILSDAGLGPSTFVAGDEIPARQSTLKAIETASGGPAIKYIEQKFTLKDDPINLRGSFERAGSMGIALRDYLLIEGMYTFHAKATYGECSGARETVWTLHVDVGIDPGRTDVKTDPLGTRPDGSECVRMTFTPRDKYGNRLGPGRAGAMNIGPRPGSTLTSPVRDLNKGVYQIDLCWDPASAEPPGITIGQPGRPPVSVGPTERRLFLYSVTFVCGEQKDDCCGCAPVRPGQYATEINIHNFSDRDASVIKRVIPLVLSGAARGREPKVAAITALDRLILPAHTATMDDCCRIQELLLGGPVENQVPLTTGILEIISTVELAVTAVYTKGDGTIDVETIPPKRL